MQCNQQEAIHQYADYKALAISKNQEPYKSFLEAVYEVDALVSLHLPDNKLAASMARILFATVITAMETYLSDTFINRVLGDNQLLRRCVETNPELRDRKLELGDIFKRQENLREEVRGYLIDILFHNVAKVRLMYQSVLNVQFPDDLGDIFRAVEKRHDIVHRGGKSKSGSPTTASSTDVRSLVRSIKEFVRIIEDQL
jgi:hypothetical protein